MVSNLGSLFIQSDCSMIEINPLVETTGGDIVALDAKVSFDENASFRHPEWEGLRDYDEEEERSRSGQRRPVFPTSNLMAI